MHSTQRTETISAPAGGGGWAVWPADGGYCWSARTERGTAFGSARTMLEANECVERALAEFGSPVQLFES